LIWNITGVEGWVSVAGLDQGKTNNDYNLFSGTPVPEGGATVALLGVAITGLRIGRRFLKS
jgi:hypothetical protein